MPETVVAFDVWPVLAWWAREHVGPLLVDLPASYKPQVERVKKAESLGELARGLAGLNLDAVGSEVYPGLMSLSQTVAEAQAGLLDAQAMSRTLTLAYLRDQLTLAEYTQGMTMLGFVVTAPGSEGRWVLP